MISRLLTVLALASLGLAGGQDSCKCVRFILLSGMEGLENNKHLLDRHQETRVGLPKALGTR